VPLHFHSSSISGSASCMIFRTRAKVVPRQSVSFAIRLSICSLAFVEHHRHPSETANLNAFPVELLCFRNSCRALSSHPRCMEYKRQLKNHSVSNTSSISARANPYQNRVLEKVIAQTQTSFSFCELFRTRKLAGYAAISFEAEGKDLLHNQY
jgi:hypothetical protein